MMRFGKKSIVPFLLKITPKSKSIHITNHIILILESTKIASHNCGKRNHEFIEALAQVSLKVPGTTEAYAVIAFQRLGAICDELLSLHRRKRRFARLRTRTLHALNGDGNRVQGGARQAARFSLARKANR